MNNILDYYRDVNDKVLRFSKRLPTVSYIAELFQRDKRRYEWEETGEKRSKRWGGREAGEIPPLQFRILATRQMG
jgi:hypothetical protein